MAETVKNLLIVAGSGTYPACLVAGARQAGVSRVTLLGLRGATARATADLADEAVWFGVGQVQNIFEWVAQQGFTHGIMAGGIPPPALFCTRFDVLARRWLAGLPVKNAHTIFGKIAVELTRRGIHVLPASCYMDDWIPGAGVLTQRTPDAREASDIAFGHRVACGIGGYDIGQTVVVKDGMILAVEAFEGTDAAIRRGGKLGGRGAVVVKVAKAGHDIRFDIPVIGCRTLPVLRRAGITALAFQANRLVMLEKLQVVAVADRLGIVIEGLESDLPAVPLRP